VRGAGFLIIIGLLALAGPAAAQERPPADRQSLLELTRVLGESHAIRLACSKNEDFQWYRRMEQLLAVEAPDQAFKTRLILAFNNGFAAGQSGFAVCDDRARAEAVLLAKRGQTLAQALTGP
jgi:uncharacterized protein (TIGR02301 family)